ncbi:MAG: DNA-3-methyladenine glycosylase 2 family protein [Acidimicrobiia bacterium]
MEFPLDLRPTLRPLGGRFLDDGWWRPARTPLGPATLRLRRSQEGLLASAWGEGAAWLLDRVPLLVGSADHPEGLVTDHPLVSDLARRHRGSRFGATGLVWEALVVAIVAQKVTGKEAGRSLKGLGRRFSEEAPGPRSLRLPPDPEPMAQAPYWDYHTLGIEKRRADVLRAAAGEARRIQRLAASSPEEAAAWLRHLRGVGEWTAAETVAVSHGDADAVSVGDYHLKNVVAWHLSGKPRGTDEEMLALLEPFRPHRGRVIRLLETRGGAPAFGPRQPLRSFTDR